MYNEIVRLKERGDNVVYILKTFKGKEVVSNVNMNVKKGEIYGFLGILIVYLTIKDIDKKDLLV